MVTESHLKSIYEDGATVSLRGDYKAIYLTNQREYFTFQFLSELSSLRWAAVF